MLRPNEAQRLRCRGDASELIAENAVGNGELVGVLAATVGGVTEDLRLRDHGLERRTEVGHDQLDIGELLFDRCDRLHAGHYPSRHESLIETEVACGLADGRTGHDGREHLGAQLGRMWNAAWHVKGTATRRAGPARDAGDVAR